MLPLPNKESPHWEDSEALECVMVVPEAPNVRTFAFRPPSGASFFYKPGQFLTLEVPVPGGPLLRTYTISSSPSQNLSISVTVKAQDDSIGSKWLIDNLQPGMKIKAHGPSGLFTLPAQPDDKYLFISAGSGITPMMSMTSYLFDRGEQPDVNFITCARRPSELIFRSRLEHMATRLPGLQLHFVVEHTDPYDVWTGYRGRFNQLMLGLMASDYLERHVYCCGPEPFMQAVRDTLHSLGFDMDHYHEESFHAPIEKPSDAPEIDDLVPQEGAAAELIFMNSSLSVHCTEDDTVLTVAKSAGLNIPNGCNFGVCGTCKVKKKSGTVHMVHNGGISEEDIDDGYILACCSHPIGKVEVEV